MIIEKLEHYLASLVLIAQFVLETLSILCVLIGLVQTLRFIFKLQRRRHHNRFPFIEVRLKFGLWLSLALELQLGADILETTIAPDLQFLARLAVLAAIRTFLNYFLNQELQEEFELKEKDSVKSLE